MSEALAAGAAPYKPPHQRQEELAQAKGKITWDFQPVADLAACSRPCLDLFRLFSISALSLEPYGLSLPISMSSCSIGDRQSPTLMSMSSGLSGDSNDPSHKGGYVNTLYKHLLSKIYSFFYSHWSFAYSVSAQQL